MKQIYVIHIFHDNQLIDSHWDWELLKQQIVFSSMDMMKKFFADVIVTTLW